MSALAAAEAVEATRRLSVQNTRSALAGEVVEMTRSGDFIRPGRNGTLAMYHAARTVLWHLYQRVAANDTADGLARGQVLPSAVPVPALAAATGLSTEAVRRALHWLDTGGRIAVSRSRGREVTAIRVPGFEDLVRGYQPIGRGVAGRKATDSIEDLRADLYDRTVALTRAGEFDGQQAARTVFGYLTHSVSADRTVMPYCCAPRAIAAATGLSEATGVRKSLTWLHEQGLITVSESSGGRHRYINSIEIPERRVRQKRMVTAPRKPREGAARKSGSQPIYPDHPAADAHESLSRIDQGLSRINGSLSRIDENLPRTDVTFSSSSSPAQQQKTISGAQDHLDDPDDLSPAGEVSLPAVARPPSGLEGGRAGLASLARSDDATMASSDDDDSGVKDKPVITRSRRVTRTGRTASGTPGITPDQDASTRSRGRDGARDDEYDSVKGLLAWLWEDSAGEPRVSLVCNRQPNRRSTGNSLKLVQFTGKEKSALLNTKQRQGDEAFRDLVQSYHEKYLDPELPDMAERFRVHLPEVALRSSTQDLFWVGRSGRSKGRQPYFCRIDKRHERIASDDKLVRLARGEAAWLMTIKSEWRDHPDYELHEDGDTAYREYVADLYDKVIGREDQEAALRSRELERAAERREHMARRAAARDSVAGDGDPEPPTLEDLLAYRGRNPLL